MALSPMLKFSYVARNRRFVAPPLKAAPDLRYHPCAMVSIGRLVLLVVLALAVPFHAAYAVGMAQCAARAHGAGDSNEIERIHAPLAHGATDAQSACEHGAVDLGVSDTDDDKHSAAASHCSACSACGTAIAIAGDAPSPFAMVRTSSRPSLLESRLDGVTPSRLDRPPLPL